MKAPAPGDAPGKASNVPLPTFGGGPTRNMVNLAAKGVCDDPDPAGDGLAWKAELGSRAYGGPTIHDGRIFVGTNNDRPRNKRDVSKVGGDEEAIDKGVLMCFDTKGQFLWQAVHKKLESRAGERLAAGGRVQHARRWTATGCTTSPTAARWCAPA